MRQRNLVPLIEGCSAAQVSYAKALRLLLVGEVRGERILGRYFIDPSDLVRWKREHASPQPVA